MLNEWIICMTFIFFLKKKPSFTQSLHHFVFFIIPKPSPSLYFLPLLISFLSRPPPPSIFLSHTNLPYLFTTSHFHFLFNFRDIEHLLFSLPRSTWSFDGKALCSATKVQQQGATQRRWDDDTLCWCCCRCWMIYSVHVHHLLFWFFSSFLGCWLIVLLCEN